MSKIDLLHKEIVERGGWILSDGTLNMCHLLPKAYDLLQSLEIHDELRQEILSCFDFGDNHFDTKLGYSLFTAQYWGECHIPADKESTANDLWNEDITDIFDSIAPTGFYFGSTEGDGACIGWFCFIEI